MNGFMATQEYEVCGVIAGGLAYCTFIHLYIY